MRRIVVQASGSQNFAVEASNKDTSTISVRIQSLQTIDNNFTVYVLETDSLTGTKYTQIYEVDSDHPTIQKTYDTNGKVIYCSINLADQSLPNPIYGGLTGIKHVKLVISSGVRKYIENFDSTALNNANITKEDLNVELLRRDLGLLYLLDQEEFFKKLDVSDKGFFEFNYFIDIPHQSLTVGIQASDWENPESGVYKIERDVIPAQALEWRLDPDCLLQYTFAAAEQLKYIEAPTQVTNTNSPFIHLSAFVNIYGGNSPDPMTLVINNHFADLVIERNLEGSLNLDQASGFLDAAVETPDNLQTFTHFRVSITLEFSAAFGNLRLTGPPVFGTIDPVITGEDPYVTGAAKLNFNCHLKKPILPTFYRRIGESVESDPVAQEALEAHSLTSDRLPAIPKSFQVVSLRKPVVDDVEYKTQTEFLNTFNLTGWTTYWAGIGRWGSGTARVGLVANSVSAGAVPNSGYVQGSGYTDIFFPCWGIPSKFLYYSDRAGTGVNFLNLFGNYTQYLNAMGPAIELYKALFGCQTITDPAQFLTIVNGVLPFQYMLQGESLQVAGTGHNIFPFFTKQTALDTSRADVDFLTRYNQLSRKVDIWPACGGVSYSDFTNLTDDNNDSPKVFDGSFTPFRSNFFGSGILLNAQGMPLNSQFPNAGIGRLDEFIAIDPTGVFRHFRYNPDADDGVGLISGYEEVFDLTAKFSSFTDAGLYIRKEGEWQEFSTPDDTVLNMTTPASENLRAPTRRTVAKALEGLSVGRSAVNVDDNSLDTATPTSESRSDAPSRHATAEGIKGVKDDLESQIEDLQLDSGVPADQVFTGPWYQFTRGENTPVTEELVKRGVSSNTLDIGPLTLDSTLPDTSNGIMGFWLPNPWWSRLETLLEIKDGTLYDLGSLGDPVELTIDGIAGSYRETITANFLRFFQNIRYRVRPRYNVTVTTQTSTGSGGGSASVGEIIHTREQISHVIVPDSKLYRGSETWDVWMSADTSGLDSGFYGSYVYNAEKRFGSLQYDDETKVPFALVFRADSGTNFIEFFAVFPAGKTVPPTIDITLAGTTVRVASTSTTARTIDGVATNFHGRINQTLLNSAGSGDVHFNISSIHAHNLGFYDQIRIVSDLSSLEAKTVDLKRTKIKSFTDSDDINHLENYRLAKMGDTDFVATLPETISFNTSLTGFTTVQVGNVGNAWGKIEQYTDDSSMRALLLHAYYRALLVCPSTTNPPYVLYKSISLGSRDGHESVIACGHETSAFGRYASNRITSFILIDPSGQPRQYVYDNTVVSNINTVPGFKFSKIKPTSVPVGSVADSGWLNSYILTDSDGGEGYILLRIKPDTDIRDYKLLEGMFEHFFSDASVLGSTSNWNYYYLRIKSMVGTEITLQQDKNAEITTNYRGFIDYQDNSIAESKLNASVRAKLNSESESGSGSTPKVIDTMYRFDSIPSFASTNTTTNNHIAIRFQGNTSNLNDRKLNIKKLSIIIASVASGESYSARLISPTGETFSGGYSATLPSTFAATSNTIGITQAATNYIAIFTFSNIEVSNADGPFLFIITRLNGSGAWGLRTVSVSGAGTPSFVIQPASGNSVHCILHNEDFASDPVFYTLSTVNTGATNTGTRSGSITSIFQLLYTVKGL